MTTRIFVDYSGTPFLNGKKQRVDQKRSQETRRLIFDLFSYKYEDYSFEAMSAKIYHHTLPSLLDEQKPIRLDDCDGKVILIVNVASL